MVEEQRGRQASVYVAKKTNDCWTEIENDTEDEKKASGTDVRSSESNNSWNTKGTAVDVGSYSSHDESSEMSHSVANRIRDQSCEGLLGRVLDARGSAGD